MPFNKVMQNVKQNLVYKTKMLKIPDLEITTADGFAIRSNLWYFPDTMGFKIEALTTTLATTCAQNVTSANAQNL